MMRPIRLSERTLSQSGPVVRVRRYLAGWHPALGELHMGRTGPETRQEQDVFRPTHTVLVEVESEPLYELVSAGVDPGHPKAKCD